MIVHELHVSESKLAAIKYFFGKIQKKCSDIVS
jgi:hypothetical protein